MGIPLAHYKSESYLDANIANNRKIIGNVRIRFGNHKVIGRGRCIRRVNTRNICKMNPGNHPDFLFVVKYGLDDNKIFRPNWTRIIDR